MSDRWQLRIDDSSGFSQEVTGPAIIGRQERLDERYPSMTRADNGDVRIVIAHQKETAISRKHLKATPQADGKMLIEAVGADVILPGNNKLDKGASRIVSLPIVLQLGTKSLRLSEVQEEDDESVESLPMATLAPGSGGLLASLQASFGQSRGPVLDADMLTAWLQAFIGLLQSAAGSQEFNIKAARSLVELVKLDCGRVLGRPEEDWPEQAVHPPPSAANPVRASRRILSRVLSEKKTFWQVPDVARGGASIQGIETVVAAPILNRRGDVIGALYGERRLNSASAILRPISKLDAMLVDVLASGVAAGLARVEQEQVALRGRMQLEQYFTKGLAAKLVDHQELLQGREALVSVLFCDIRGFSRISERLGPAKTVDWIRDVMTVLSQCVLDHQGVVVDYIGDELMAMWGAPEEMADHAVRACRAALAMRERMPEVNARWQSILGEPLEVGIGINSGPAQVGNVGSTIKFKYGPLGNSVNLASRVQGATKHLHVKALITAATHSALAADEFATRRLCQVRVVNIAEPVTLFELIGSSDDKWLGLKYGYESALEEFTNGEWHQACRILGRLMPDHPDDGPTLILLARAVNCLVEKPEKFDPVWELFTK